MADFLGSLGATDRGKTADTTQNILRAFGDFPDYPAQPSDDKPVAIHYAPMHLYKLPEFPAELKPFCALSVTARKIAPADATAPTARPSCSRASRCAERRKA